MKTKIGITFILLIMLVACSRCMPCPWSSSTDNLDFNPQIVNVYGIVPRYDNGLNHFPIKVRWLPSMSESETSIKNWNEIWDHVPDIFVYSEDESVIKIHIYDLDYILSQPDIVAKIKTSNYSVEDLATTSTIYAKTFLIPGACIIVSKHNDSAVLEHELGHCLGFGHDNDPTAVMYACVNSEMTFTDRLKEKLKFIKPIEKPAPNF